MAADRVPRTLAVSGIGLVASLLVIFGLFLHRIGQTPGTNGGDNPLSNATSAMKSSALSSAAAGQPISGDGGPAPPDYLAPIAHFLGLSMTELCSSGPRLGERTVLADDPARYWVDAGARVLAYKPEFLIAMLPDPDRSRSGFRFTFGSNRWTASQRNRPKHLDRTFVLDHYYLPWKHAGEERPSDSQTPRTFPGVLVFRSTPPREEKPPAPPHTLIVFLIGDVLIGGIRQAGSGNVSRHRGLVRQRAPYACARAADHRTCLFGLAVFAADRTAALVDQEQRLQ